jgi:hypothetical protein
MAIITAEVFKQVHKDGVMGVVESNSPPKLGR